VAISATMPANAHVAVTVTDLAVSEEWYTHGPSHQAGERGGMAWPSRSARSGRERGLQPC
jgi:hypothetical protein